MLMRLIVILGSIFLVSCSYLPSSMVQSRDKAYLSAQSIPPLKIPPGIRSDAYHAKYPVSDRTYPKAAVEKSIVPPGLND